MVVDHLRRRDLPAGIGALAERQAVQVDPAHLPDDLMRIELAVRGVLSSSFPGVAVGVPLRERCER